MNNLIASGIAPAGGGIIQNSLLKGSQLENIQMLSTTDSSYFISHYLPKFIGLTLVFGAVAFFFMFVWGAINWILSGGDKAHLESAKAKITNAIIGLALMIGVFAVIKVIETFFGVNILSIDIGPLVIQ